VSTEESREAVKNAWRAFASRDPQKIAAAFTDDAQWIAPPGNGTALALGLSEYVLDRDAIVAFITKDFGRLFLDTEREFRGFYAEGSTVVVDMRLSAKLPNGGTYQNDYVFVCECRDGRVAKMREFMDTLGGHRQLFEKGHPLAAG
jgi:ketosteroid isomerase-like protein